MGWTRPESRARSRALIGARRSHGRELGQRRGYLDGAVKASGHRAARRVYRQHPLHRFTLVLADGDAAVGDMNPLDHQYVSLELNLSSCLSDQTGRVYPSGG